MELPQVLEPYIKEGVHPWTGPQLTELGYDNLEAFQAFSEILDTLGAESGEAQHLKGALTSVTILRQERSLGEQRRCYVLRERSKVLGLLTIGRKHLYYWHRGGGTKQLDPLCVLDFYVSGKAQRAGYGFKLFEAMLAAEGREARCFAYDRPSPKMLPFLRKHYGLADYNEQPNNFVVFDDYFDDGPPKRRTEVKSPSKSDVIQADAGRVVDIF